MKKTIKSLGVLIMTAILSVNIVSAASCYPSYDISKCFEEINECLKTNCNKKILCSDRVYLGAVEGKTSHIYVYANKPFFNGIEQKSGLDLTFYIWKGTPCKDDEYLGRIYGAVEAYKKNSKICLKKWYAQVKETDNQWKTYYLGEGCMDDRDAFKLGVKLALFPYILKNAVKIPIWKQTLDLRYWLPWPWFFSKLPVKWVV